MFLGIEKYYFIPSIENIFYQTFIIFSFSNLNFDKIEFQLYVSEHYLIDRDRYIMFIISGSTTLNYQLRLKESKLKMNYYYCPTVSFNFHLKFFLISLFALFLKFRIDIIFKKIIIIKTIR